METDEPSGPYGAKGVAEAPLVPTAAAVTNAVCHALGVEINTIPLTPERVLRALDGKQQINN